MDAVSLLRLQLQHSHEWLEATMAGVTEAQAHWMPLGIANPLGATYAHAAVGEDVIVAGMLQEMAPLCATVWSNKTGLSELMPMPGPEYVDYPAWTRRVRIIDLPALKAYAQAVYTASDDYLASLNNDDLDRPMDLSGQGFGKVNAGWVISRLVIGHIDNHCGEIACLKGLQGVQGYPR